MKKTLLFLVIIVAGFCSCKKVNIGGGLRNNSTLAAELKSSPEAIVIGSNHLILTAYLWRDFMPPTEENGRPMICINRLTDKNGNAISNAITLKKQHIVKGNEVWSEVYSEIKNAPSSILEGVVRNGPKWGPNIMVDVICEFECQGKTYRILVKNQNIEATY